MTRSGGISGTDSSPLLDLPHTNPVYNCGCRVGSAFHPPTLPLVRCSERSSQWWRTRLTVKRLLANGPVYVPVDSAWIRYRGSVQYGCFRCTCAKALYCLDEPSGCRKLVGSCRSPVYWIHCILPSLAVWEGKTWVTSLPRQSPCVKCRDRNCSGKWGLISQVLCTFDYLKPAHLDTHMADSILMPR